MVKHADAAKPAPEEAPAVIEVVTAKLRDDVAIAQMEALDLEIGTRVIAARPGFLSRESAPGDDHDWLAIVRWRSVADADAAMAAFPSEPDAARFMALIVPGSLVMKRYARRSALRSGHLTPANEHEP